MRSLTVFTAPTPHTHLALRLCVCVCVVGYGRASAWNINSVRMRFSQIIASKVHFLINHSAHPFVDCRSMLSREPHAVRHFPLVSTNRMRCAFLFRNTIKCKLTLYLFMATVHVSFERRYGFAVDNVMIMLRERRQATGVTVCQNCLDAIDEMVNHGLHWWSLFDSITHSNCSIATIE